MEEKLEQRRKHWTKNSLEDRRRFCLLRYLDPEVISVAKPEELVQYCLILDGVACGLLPYKKAEKEPVAAPTAAPVTLTAADILQLMADQRREDARIRKEEREAELARIEAKEKATADRLREEKDAEIARCNAERDAERIRKAEKKLAKNKNLKNY